ncbi:MULTISPECIES: GNAT family N-acetyltransferase [unclassified Streptomyces]|uniref:GNAT family N-acetyltransferase n=1 Tax=unclassified Streptomyces TaxID=2593676 RepID=UPI001CB759B7|nr:MULTISPECIES: GNAT family N-acetyltransferase [unclassified Streptomyces]MBD0711594.1 GNAT family N-acetyltransferase [Streptomyces sp. CBMA291]MBD0714791.1 GNAT family N-acetyltransferase [Streptomyces sp. CBMA370]
MRQRPDGLRVRPAGPADVPALMALRAEAERWLGSRGTDQWSDPVTGARALAAWRRSVDEGRVWVVEDESGAILATVGRALADRDFWTEADRPETAFHLCKLIVARAAAGRHLGARVVDWAARLAAWEGRDWVRVDTWRTNAGLHAYYERLGFTHVRTESPAHRRSGWLAQRPVGLLSHPDEPLTPGSARHGPTGWR